MSKVDLFKLEVIHGALISIVEEMGVTLIRTAYSTIVREERDCSCAIFDPRGRLVAQAEHIPQHLGAMDGAIKDIIRAYLPDGIQQGDIFIVNHPYRGGGAHTPDTIIVTPVFWDEEIVAFAANMAHLLDFGGKVPGTLATDSTEIYQEGLLIPPLKLYEAGKSNDALFEIIKANVREPEKDIGDIKAQIAANRTGERRMRELLKKYGKDALLACVENIMDYSERMTRKDIRKIPDGEYESVGYLDDDGVERGRPVKIKVAIIKKGDNIRIDFTGTDSQVKGPYNAVLQVTKAVCYYFVRCFIDPNIPQNDGCLRPIEIVAPEGTLVNPKPPAACGLRHTTSLRMADTLLHALAKGVHDKSAAGCSVAFPNLFIGFYSKENGKYKVFTDVNGGGFGARPFKDGLDAIDIHMGNCLNVPIEAVEMEYPIRIERYELIKDSGGAGKYRGGLGYRRDYRILEEAIGTVMTDQTKSTPWGLSRGKDGTSAKILLNGESTFSKASGIFLKPGDLISLITAGSGGYGDPSERDPKLVLKDVMDEKISIDSAYNDYKVVIDVKARKVNEQATDKLRKQCKL